MSLKLIVNGIVVMVRSILLAGISVLTLYSIVIYVYLLA